MNQYYFEDKTNKNNLELEKMTNSLLSYLIEQMKIEKDVILSCTICDDTSIQKINCQYRNIDKPTDVISFAYNDYNEGDDEPFIDLGEIVISLDTANKQAIYYNHPLEREIAFLFIHGFLHLNGYDHIQKDEADIMFNLQNELLNNFNYEYKELNVNEIWFE